MPLYNIYTKFKGIRMNDFIASSPVAKELKNSAELLKSLLINALIIGDEGTGKKALAKYIANDALVVDAKEFQNDVANNVLNIDDVTVIIDNIDQITNIDLFINYIETHNLKIIATTQKEELNTKLQNLFSITLVIPPLDQRKEDIKPLAEKFSKEAMQVLGMEKKPHKLLINTKHNAHSLRKSIYFSFLFESLGESEIMMLLEKHIMENMDGENNYRDFLYLFEAPLLKSAQKLYKSQVQMAKHLGLNRITLRKKLETHKELL